MKTVTRFSRPVIVVSRCLCGARCRWDGDTVPSSLVRTLKDYAKIIPVCPEMEIGLSVPRERIILVRHGRRVELFQPASGRRLAQTMNRFAHQFLSQVGEVDGFILKHKSPTCGLRGVKVYESIHPDAEFVRNGVGLFAARATAMWPHAAIEDEEHLADHQIREHWLTRLFTLAAWRAAKHRGTATSLLRFHEYYFTLLSAYNKRPAQELECIASSWQAKRSCPTREYERHLLQILQKPPRRTSLAKPFERALSHYAQFIRPEEQRDFVAQLKQYAAGSIPLSHVRRTVQIWAVRYDKAFIRQDSIYRPYPGPLAGM